MPDPEKDTAELREGLDHVEDMKKEVVDDQPDQGGSQKVEDDQGESED